MGSRKRQYSSESSEDADDPPPLLQASNRHEGFRSSEDTDEQPSPSKRPRGFSSLSEEADDPQPQDMSSSEDDNEAPDDESNHDDLPNINLSGDDSDCPQPANSSQVRHGAMYSVIERPKTLPPSKLVKKRDRGLSFLSNSTSADSVDTDQDDDGELPPKHRATAAMRMMASMGYKEGKGLGKHGQGIVEPISASTQRGRRGLGLKIPALGTAGLKFDSSMEVVSAKEAIDWLTGPGEPAPAYDEMHDWLLIGPRKRTIDDETSFCLPLILSQVLSSKSVFDALDGKELMKARSRANPFEHIRGVFFLNRAAMKMANMDAVFNFMFTNPRDQNGKELLGPKDLLYFADVCAGPGGFTEYVLWKKKWHAKGIGFTLKGTNDFKLEDFYAAPCETFEPYYGVKDDGNVYTPENIVSLHEHVMDATENLGVHFMMADGGFSVEGQENLQEVLSKRLYLCQCLVALRIVRVGGHFVVKLFDVFTPFSVGLIYLMYRCFARISIHKPNTSRPANSERYMICAFKRDDCEGVVEYMTRINETLEQLEKTEEDVTDIVPMELLTSSNSEFFNYIVKSNNSLGERQVVQLLKIAAFCEDPSLHESKQYELRRECLSLYKIPDRTRAAPPAVIPQTLANELLGRPVEKLNLRELTSSLLQKQLQEVRDWMCCVIGSKSDDDVRQPTFFVGMGGSNVYRYVGRERWEHLPAAVELPRRTLLLGEMIQEFEGGRGNQTRVWVLHILDAAWLGDEDIRREPLETRLALCKTFAKAIRRSGNPVVAKPFVPLADLDVICSRLECREHKTGVPCLGLGQGLSSSKFLKPYGLLCMSRTKGPWWRCFSKTAQREYFFNYEKNLKAFEQPKDSVADFDWSLNNLRMWWWEEGVKMRPFQQFNVNQDLLQPEQILRYIQYKKDSEKAVPTATHNSKNPQSARNDCR